MSSFIDHANIYVKGGKGGDGMVAFRREKFVPDGGPAGGDGGRGGDVVFRVDEGLRTLLDFKYKRHFKAKPGENGMSKSMYGRGADDLIVSVPPGTVVRDSDTGQILADLVENGEEVIVAKGGRGGRGNKKFATHSNPAPEIAENGEPAQERNLTLELKIIADAGLVGYPSVGKSSIIRLVSRANAKVGNYPFTTITPNIGVVRTDDHREFVMADLPGLIEGASEGVGLGIQFLRHVERTRVILHVIDMAGTEGRDPYEDYKVINNELRKYDPALLERPMIIVANKMDMPDAEENLKEFKAKLDADQGDNQPKLVEISAWENKGIEALTKLTADEIERANEMAIETSFQPSEEDVLYEMPDADDAFTITVDEDNVWVVEGEKVEKLVKMTNLNYDESALRFARQLRGMGVDKALIKAGIQEGDIVRIVDFEFEFIN